MNLKYLMTKKVYKQKYFSAITMNSNWKIISKNVVTFKRSDGVKVYLCYKMITSLNVSSEAQIKNFFIS